ncbi:2561_t:CDS:2 [Paraglomus brasilianum]|uniref:2561_t:CDS:1 n=1 Tax=Paraglomus brasilianum TaxID=144538 RepID=A0A9N9EIQ5_9GLOM|nr:2561_t:CDS:2 [Paraglomus brasilianum]
MLKIRTSGSDLPNQKKSQTEIPNKASDKRRGRIDLTRARRGLKAEDPLSDSE